LGIAKANMVDEASKLMGQAGVGYRAGAAFWLGLFFVVLISFPGLGELPNGISLALALMLVSLPVWYGAALARERPVFDVTARKAAGVTLACVAFLILWSLLSVLGSEHPVRVGRYVATLVAAYALFFLVAGTLTLDRLRAYVDVLCFSLAFTCFLSLVAYYEPHLRALIFQDTDRAFGFFKNPNQFGMALSTVLPIALANSVGRSRGRGAHVFCLGLLLFGLVACGSKTNLLISSLTMVLMLCAYSTVAFSGARRIYMIGLSIVATAVLVAGGLVLLNLFNPRALRLMLAFFGQDSELHSLVSRSQLWQYSLDQFSISPFLGQGAGQPIIIFYRDEAVPHSHNVLLDYLRTLGVPGCAGLLIILGTAVAMSVATAVAALRAEGAEPRYRILSIGLSVGCLSYIAANMSSDSMGPSTSPFFWLILFLGLASRATLRPLTVLRKQEP
jgi:O-antigen ligase